MNILKDQSVCIYFLFGPSNMEFEDRNFGLQFTRVSLVHDDSIAQKLCRKTSEIVMNYNET